jgi:serine O-acetyltransferase
MKSPFTSSLPAQELSRYLARQLSHFYPDKDVPSADLSGPVEQAIERLNVCFAGIQVKYFSSLAGSTFNHLNTDHYAMFLYFVCNTLFRQKGDLALASKVYALNKALHGIDVFYEVELPDIFFLQHPVGTVLGRAKYSNYLAVYQRCTVGGNMNTPPPTLGEGVVLYSGSSVLGECAIGDNCWISAESLILNTDIPSGNVVFGQSPTLTISPTWRNVKQDVFGLKAHG